MIRPEAAQTLRRWSEPLIGAGVALLGVYWGFFTGGGLLHYIGYAVLLLGAVMVYSGVQRARFAQGGGGPGLVQIVEGRVSYFGPETGGVVDLSDLRSLTLNSGKQRWELRQEGHMPLYIPLKAEGAEALFDAYATLPGIRIEHMLAQLEAGGDHSIVIWQAGPTTPKARRLH
ncbi:hypothetical protein [Pseudoprimorskyibacter insulae]|uniref:Uncharacterized protein n=1 Tax=Pseudoprimorskyibacter insulae TaxID=1695997 RepID=A0A2R8AUM4_9RHOB|nr:hypothetical protein [Pseudoprimorskyibacter insulae]SPF79731.1 hypothetical protein PRI8871_01528 [Pseudoprimorskyibacter insulae]